MKRDIEKAIKETRGRRGKYDLHLSETYELLNRAEQNLVNGIYDAFQFGFTLGVRYEKSRNRKRKAAM